MVWNQYVYEATTGNEIDYSDDEYENDQLENVSQTLSFVVNII